MYGSSAPDFPIRRGCDGDHIGGAVRHYTDSDTRVYMLNDDKILYKYWRALKPVPIGTVSEVMSGSAIVACDKIRGRSGLPWEREI